MPTYSPTEFVSKLSQDELHDPAEVTIGGLVKVDEKSSSVIYFSNSLSCEKWLPIPLELIASIDHISNVACKDHEHPLVKITFKQPDEARQDLVFFLSMLSELQNFISSAHSAPRAGSQAKKLRDDRDDCFLISFKDSLQLCCVIPFEDDVPLIQCTNVLDILKPK